MSQCPICDENRNSSPRKPLLSHPVPDRLWDKVGTDLFHIIGSEFLLWVDYFPKFPEIAKLRDTTSPQYASAEVKDFS